MGPRRRKKGESGGATNVVGPSPAMGAIPNVEQNSDVQATIANTAMGDASVCTNSITAAEPNGETSARIRFSPETLMADRLAQPDWAIPNQPRDTVYREGEGGSMGLSLIKPHATAWIVGSLPGDIHEFNFATIEDRTRRVSSVVDDWKSDYLRNPQSVLGNYQRSNPPHIL